jgi:hypothetical protein
MQRWAERDAREQMEKVNAHASLTQRTCFFIVVTAALCYYLAIPIMWKGSLG